MPTMLRFAFLLVAAGVLAILLTIVLVLGDATLPGRLPPLAAALLAGGGGVALVLGLFLLEPRSRQPSDLLRIEGH